MTTANDVEDIESVERNLVKLGYLPGCLPVDEKRQPTATEEPRNSKMSFIRKILFALAIMAVLTVTVVCGIAPRIPRSPSVKDQKKFLAILDSAKPGSLHELLHEHIDQYKDGVFQEDKAAIAAVHHQDTEVASNLVNLVKKQDGANNSTAVPPVTSTEVTTIESTSTVVTPITSSTIITETSTTPPTQQTTPTTSAPSTNSPTVISTPPTSRSQDASPTVSSRSTSAIQTSGPSSTSQTPPTTTPPSGSSTDIDESQSVTSLEIFTSTAANGAPTTITQTTVIPANQADKTAGAAGGKTSTASPSLQRSEARSSRAGMSAIAGFVVSTVGLVLTNVL